MAKELKHIDISTNPELRRIVEEVRESQESRILRFEHEDIAILSPIRRPTKRRVLKGRPTSAEDPLWKIIGMAAGPDDQVTDVSANKDKYLAEAYVTTHE